MQGQRIRIYFCSFRRIVLDSQICRSQGLRTEWLLNQQFAGFSGYRWALKSPRGLIKDPGCWALPFREFNFVMLRWVPGLHFLLKYFR